MSDPVKWRWSGGWRGNNQFESIKKSLADYPWSSVNSRRETFFSRNFFSHTRFVFIVGDITWGRSSPARESWSFRTQNMLLTTEKLPKSRENLAENGKSGKKEFWLSRSFRLFREAAKRRFFLSHTVFGEIMKLTPAQINFPMNFHRVSRLLREKN